MIEINIKHQVFGSDGQMTLQIDEKIEGGSFVGVFGKSGVGKTTFFKILSGLIKPDFGYIKIRETVLLDTENEIFIPPQKRNMAFMFQDYALFPNMTVKQNITFAQPKEKKNNKYIDYLLDVFELTLLDRQYPEKLSGGQQQRVALARALSQQAEILLFDEPLSAVDREMRTKILGEISKYHKQNKLTVFVISHNKNEFKELINRIISL